MTTIKPDPLTEEVPLGSGVRHLERRDIPQVAELFMRILKDTKGTISPDLISYFETAYFANPWLADGIQSLVYDDAGDITGFIGVMPRTVCLDGKKLRIAVVGNFMFDQEARSRSNIFGAVEIIRELIAGPQDLTISVTANDKSRGIWEMCGGTTSHLYSFRWVYMIRPLRYAAERWRKTSESKALSLGTNLLAGPADFAFRMARGRSDPSDQGLTVADLAVSDIIDGLPTLTQYHLLPHYQENDLRWLLDMAARKKSEGDLRAKTVTDAKSKKIGWFVYYRDPHGPSQVLQIGAGPNALALVFDCLLHDAQQSSTSALTGQLCPTMAQHFASRNCISAIGSWALLHARDPDIISRFDRGTAMFSGLESEQWLRFIGDFKH